MKITITNFLFVLYLIFASVLLFAFNNLLCFTIINIFLVILIVLCFKINVKNPIVLFITISSDNVLKKRLEKMKSSENLKKIELMTSAAVDVAYKDHKYVIRAMKILLQNGIKTHYYLACSGNQKRLKKIAMAQGVEDYVHFLGELSTMELYKYLVQIDIYIQPSLQECLPRAVVETMSRGCTVIGTRTAGIPELVTEKFLVNRKSHLDIVKKVEEYVNLDTDARQKIAIENFEHSKKYKNTVLERKKMITPSMLKMTLGGTYK